MLLLGLARARFVRTRAVPALAIVTLAVTAGLTIWQWNENVSIIEGALAMDDFTHGLTLLFCAAGLGTVLLSWRSAAAEEAGEGEYYALLLTSILGMVVLVAAENFVVLFLGFELLSIPLYVLCATHMRREHSLESGLKYLIIGSLGSATLLYGLALIYGATGSTDFAGVAAAVGELRDDTLLLAGIALVIAGLAFKASVAPFHQWTPDVYEGAPTPITAFMAVATKAAAFGVILRLFDVALIGASDTWAPALATLATVTIVVGNVGAIGQSSLKRLLAYSSVAQAGYMLAGVVVSTRLGIQATIFYLAGYLLMNMAAFAVITARERESEAGDDISSLYGLGADRPALAWPMTIAMLSLAGFPATVGFFGKLYLIQAAVDNEYAWLGVVIVLGSAISLVYYLRVIAAVWMRPASDAAPVSGGRVPGARPAMAGGSPEADAEGARARSPRGRRCGGGRGGPARAHAPPAPARGDVRRRAVRDRHGRVRDLPRPALRPRPRRGRGDRLARLARVPGGELPRGAPTRGVAPPPPRPHPAAGQASLEYVGLLALVATALAVAAPAAGLAGVPAQVAQAVRTGVCIVAGDVCRASDAAAAGLAPCTLSERRRGGGLAVTVLSVQVGGDHRFLVTRRSDGSVGVTKLARDELGASGGLGLEAGPLKLGVEGEAGVKVAAGVGWEFPDAASARRFLAVAMEGLSPAVRRWPVAWRSGEAALATSGWAGLGVLATGEDGKAVGGPAAGIEVAAESAIGARIARGARRSTCARRRRGRARPARSPGCCTPARPGRSWPSTRATAAARASSRSA